jgi:hypothetical protein
MKSIIFQGTVDDAGGHRGIERGEPLADFFTWEVWTIHRVLVMQYAYSMYIMYVYFYLKS